MRNLGMIQFEPTTLFDKAVLNHYKNIMVPVTTDRGKGLYMMYMDDYERHVLGNSEFNEALKDTKLAAAQLKNMNVPANIFDISWGKPELAPKKSTLYVDDDVDISDIAVNELGDEEYEVVLAI